MTNLAPNFTVAELCPHNEFKKLPADVRENLAFIAQRLQVIRDIIGKPIQVTSGFRDTVYNQSVGGEPNSYHVKGMAADIVVPGMDALEVQKLLKHWCGGLGCYPSFTHVDIGPRRRWGDNLPRIK